MSADDRRASLLASIERLHEVSARYLLEDDVDGCPHCTTDADHAAIHPTLLKRLTATDLERFAFKTMTTWGDVSDFKDFLPRMFELVAVEGDIGDTDVEVVFGKLEYARWSTWPTEEKKAVSDYCASLWRWVLGKEPVDDDEFSLSDASERYLGALDQAMDDVGRFLAAWQNDYSLERCDTCGG
jgi:hypothetical protein